MKTHQIDLREKDVKPGPWKQENIDAEANLLIAGWSSLPTYFLSLI